MSQYVAELCKLLITDNFGELYSLIFSYLHHYGRQTLPRIVHNTHLSPRQVRHGLAVLIQHQFIYHYTSFDDGTSYYEANRRSAYRLVRSGKILQLVEERLGKYGAKVVSTILALGHVKVSYLESLPELQPKEPQSAAPKSNGLNGIHETEDDTMNGVLNESEENLNDHDPIQESDDEQDQTSPQLQHILGELAAFGYIVRVRDNHFHGPADLHDAAVRAVVASGDTEGLKGKKLEDKIAEKASNLVEQWSDGTISRGFLPRKLHRLSKRRAEKASSEHPRKRVKLQHGIDQDEHDDEDELSDDEYTDNYAPLDSNLVIRVNYDKFDVAFRNRRLIELSEQNTTTATSEVYETLLSRIEVQTPKCRQQLEAVLEGEEGEQYSVPIPLHTIVSDLDPNLDLVGEVAGLSAPGSNRSPLQNGHEDPDEDDEDDDDEEDDDEDGQTKGKAQNRTFQVEQHLSLLASEPHLFSARTMQSGVIAWAVEYRHLARNLRHLEIERIAESRFGSFAVRVIRVLSAKGKLDEKRLQEISLMPSKDLRQILGVMQSAGFVDLQEVPRDAQRQPSRTIYLWFYDADRVATMILEDTYKSMSRCLQRLEVERNKLKFLIEKAERSDVKLNIERYLSPAEMSTLKDWQTKEAALVGEVARLDDLVAVLNDY